MVFVRACLCSWCECRIVYAGAFSLPGTFLVFACVKSVCVPLIERVYVFVLACVCVCVCVYTHTHIRTTRTHIRINIYTYIYTHTQAKDLRLKCSALPRLWPLSSVRREKKQLRKEKKGKRKGRKREKRKW